MITALLIDDEIHSRNVLRRLLNKHFPDLNILTEAKSADEGYDLISELKPQLVFLDVQMPEKNGFDLLKQFERIDFEVIFVSAFNEYAVTAFDFNALGYVLKPIDLNKLILTVNKAISKIESNSRSYDLSQFVKTLEPESQTVKKISLHHNEKVVLVSIADILSIQSNSGICDVRLTNDKHYYSSKDLKLFEDLLNKSGNFMRINKNCILNLDFIKSYQKGEICVLEMQNGQEFEVSRRKKTEIITRLNPF